MCTVMEETWGDGCARPWSRQYSDGSGQFHTPAALPPRKECPGMFKVGQTSGGTKRNWNIRAVTRTQQFSRPFHLSRITKHKVNVTGGSSVVCIPISQAGKQLASVQTASKNS
jgi:hypothetical protein